MRDRITVALIGAGRIGLEHAKNLASFPQVQVALVCDTATTLLRFKSGALGWLRIRVGRFMATRRCNLELEGRSADSAQ